MERHHSVIIAAVAVGVTIAAASCGGMPHGDGVGVRTTSRGAVTQIAGASEAQRRLLREIVATLPSARLSRLRVVPVRGGVVVRAPARSVVSTWDVLVLGETFYHRSVDEHLPRVVAVQAGAAGWPTSNLVRRPPRATADDVLATRRALRRLVRASGARAVRLAVARPDGLAVVVRVRVRDAARFLRERLQALVTRARARVGDAAGLLIAVQDAKGPAWVNADSGLGGIHDVRPALRGCDPFATPRPRPARALRRCASAGAAVRGRLAGAIRFVGGPAGSGIEKRRQRGSVALMRGGRIIVGTRVRRGRPYLLAAPPGRYRLAGRSGDAQCRPRYVTVRRGATQRADLVCDVR